MTAETDTVRGYTGKETTRRLDHQRLKRIHRFATASPEEANRHLYELDTHWDIERRLEANPAVITLLSLALAVTHSRSGGWSFRP